MPCDSSHMQATGEEKTASMLIVLLDELDGQGPPNPRTYGNGYDPRTYNMGEKAPTSHEMARELCERLQAMKPETIARHSLELQMWWRDHQEADRERIAFEMRRIRDDEVRAEALAKLTPYERALLGVD